MKIIIVSATAFEVEPSISKIKSPKNVDVSFVVTGVGMLATAVNLCKIINEQKPDFIIQVGIAGCFDDNYKLGQTVVVAKEFLGDVGVEENNKWNDIFDLGFVNKSEKPFTNKSLINKHIKKINHTLPVVNAVTVNQITTQQQHIKQLTKKYKPIVESMEGAALHYVCNSFNVPYLQIRSISNYIGERDKSKWKMKESISNLNMELKKIIEELSKSKI